MLRAMQLREHYGRNKKYFWFYSIAVFGVALLLLWVLGHRAATSAPTNAEVNGSTHGAEPTEAKQPVAAPTGVVPPPNGPLGQGIVPGRKDDTDGTRDPSH